MRALNLGQPLGGTVDAKVNWLVDAVKKIELSSREEYAESTPIKAITGLTNIKNVQAALEALLDRSPSGTYTPTLTNTTNLDASTAFACTYIQIGNAVFVAWRFEADATAAAACVMGMSLPVAANFSAASQLNGNGISSAGNAVRITADTTNDRAQFSWTSGVTVNAAFNGLFGYIIP